MKIVYSFSFLIKIVYSPWQRIKSTQMNDNKFLIFQKNNIILKFSDIHIVLSSFWGVSLLGQLFIFLYNFFSDEFVWVGDPTRPRKPWFAIE